MKVTETSLPGVLIVEPRIFGDRRGYFLETYHRDRYSEAGIPGQFVQDNLSFSCCGTLRGLHLQHPHAQGKLVQVLQGEVFDVAVDVRRGSPSFGKWTGVWLSAENHRQFWIPEGFAHGFCVVSETALFSYKCTDIYHPDCELSIRWDDPDIGIDWPPVRVSLSDKDSAAANLAAVPEDALPAYREGPP
ncbi:MULTISPECIES: dTDP-4-dehydrorhamnose 3,5-epimerase [unclassified Thioalkalivibrio]|uniref:dTDP-4-dehydrorhamnose 3,5-epimerase n=1 Tax=unclassified Thioalkalivibrio TaxID=2621013 RepID=UPI00037C879D|nr:MULTISPECIES: dTDP-4-dehydrorhamnose 3,5-epimerase [unclassified Thioalkalivibrio]